MLGMIPDYLRQYVTQQNYELYTPIDHASWRYILKVSQSFFREHAHPKYVSGLELTGITIDRIPRIEEMDLKLQKFGWRAAAVTGFIPPAIFLEFLSLGVLPIACDMRRLEHLEYTPAPDIVHEAAGHAPILSDPKFASYLHKFGEIARKAIFAKEDLEVYEAVKYLSDIKEDPRTTENEIATAYKRLTEAQEKVTYVSEASQLSRLGWWSTEYGLVRVDDQFKIYGAGLLSSVGESYNAIKGQVEKIPLTIDCVGVNFDITKQQPQLFYVEDIHSLEGIIDQLAAMMAYTIGGLEGLLRAQRARTVTTAVLDTGLQISGVLSNVVLSENSDQPIYLQYQGPTQLAYQDGELPGHSAKYHVHGFGTPLGPIHKESPGRVEFSSGVLVEGQEGAPLVRDGKTLVRTFTNCRVSRGERVYFQPEWGTFDMACGQSVVSVFGGAADRAAYLMATDGLNAKVKAQASNRTKENEYLIPLYQTVRQWREAIGTEVDVKKVKSVLQELDRHFPQDWLLRLEIYELLVHRGEAFGPVCNELLAKLKDLQKKSQVFHELIGRGLELIKS
jgi:phenylalanine-4-hydroxylase